MLLVGTTISSFGSQLYILAVSFHLYRLTGSIAAIAAMWVARIAARLGVQPIAAGVVDQWDKKRVMVTAQLVSGVAAALFVLLDANTIALVYVLAFVLQVADAFGSPTLGAALVHVVAPEELLSANSLRTIAGKCASFLGPAVAGLLFATIGPTPIYLFNGLSFLVAATAMARLPVPETPRSDRSVKDAVAAFGANLASGVKFSSHSSLVLVVLLLSIVNSLVWRVMEVVLVPLADDVLRVGSSGLGLMYSAMTVGGLVAAFVVPRWSRLDPSPRFIAGVYGLLALPLVVLAPTVAATSRAAPWSPRGPRLSAGPSRAAPDVKRSAYC